MKKWSTIVRSRVGRAAHVTEHECQWKYEQQAIAARAVPCGSCFGGLRVPLLLVWVAKDWLAVMAMPLMRCTLPDAIGLAWLVY